MPWFKVVVGCSFENVRKPFLTERVGVLDARVSAAAALRNSLFANVYSIYTVYYTYYVYYVPVKSTGDRSAHRSPLISEFHACARDVRREMCVCLCCARHIVLYECDDALASSAHHMFFCVASYLSHSFFFVILLVLSSASMSEHVAAVNDGENGFVRACQSINYEARSV